MRFIYVTDTLGNTLAINTEKIVRIMETKDGRPIVCFDNGVSPTIFVKEAFLDFISRLNSN